MKSYYKVLMKEERRREIERKERLDQAMMTPIHKSGRLYGD